MNAEFLVIGDFVSKGLRNVFLADNAKGGFLVESCRKSSPRVTFNLFSEKTRDLKGFIPLVLCDDRESLKKMGIMCPYEFVVSRNDLFPLVKDNGDIVSEPKVIMAMRLRMLADLYGTEMDFSNALRDWFAGAFRLMLMLDSTTHGTSQYVDLELVKNEADPILNALAEPQKENEDENVARLRRRFNGNGDDEVKDYLPLAKVLFSEYFCVWENGELPYAIPSTPAKISKLIDRSITKVLTWPQLGEDDKRHQLCRIYTDSGKAMSGNKISPREHKDRLPLAFGDRAKYVTPTGKLNLLLIDDKVNQSPFAHLEEKNGHDDFSSTISNDDWSLLRDIFNVQTMQVDKNKGDIYKEAEKTFRKFQEAGLTYDLILVDLCLGNNVRGADLDGYAMIRIVKVFFPGTPIVVYSRFSDMEHIARAFFNGAKWFLVKGEEAKLPRHVLKLLKQVGWHREWRAIENSANRPDWCGDKSTPFFQKFLRMREWQYLTYKSLEYFPGSYITVKQMGGGISSAVTFKATKGVKLGDNFLQTPSIIKIDTSYNTLMEFERYFRMIRPYIANESGRVEMPERVLNRMYSSIVYTFAGKQDKVHELASMGDMLDDDIGCQTACDYESYRYALACIFDEILPKIHRVSPELELGDIGKQSVLQAEVMDAFAWKDELARKTSFPNFYFGEFCPTDFLKSYMLRMQPWGEIEINDVTKGEKGLFNLQEVIDICKISSEKSIKTNQSRLIFHNVMQYPFAEKKEDPKAGTRIIEAYIPESQKLIWLEGDVCDFVARFRKRVAPGTSLWIQDEQIVRQIQKMADGRIDWLKNTFKHRGKGNESANDFCVAIADMLGINSLDGKSMKFYTKLQDAIITIAQNTCDGRAKDWRMKCPVGIVHGDLNVKNIMLESRKHAPKDDDPDVAKTVSDVWLIDFARTRRDLIAHDFNVFFTSVLGELFMEGLIGKEDEVKSARQQHYWGNLTANFKVVVSAAVAPTSKNEKGIPDEIKDDQRFTLIYRILRRTHDAARNAGVSQNMYLLTTALACLYTLKIFLNNGCRVRLAAGYFASAWICYDLLCENIGEKNQMEKFKKPSDNRTRSGKARGTNTK